MSILDVTWFGPLLTPRNLERLWPEDYPDQVLVSEAQWHNLNRPALRWYLQMRLPPNMEITVVQGQVVEMRYRGVRVVWKGLPPPSELDVADAGLQLTPGGHLWEHDKGDLP